MDNNELIESTITYIDDGIKNIINHTNKISNRNKDLSDFEIKISEYNPNNTLSLEEYLFYKLKADTLEYLIINLQLYSDDMFNNTEKNLTQVVSKILLSVNNISYDSPNEHDKEKKQSLNKLIEENNLKRPKDNLRSTFTAIFNQLQALNKNAQKRTHEDFSPFKFFQNTIEYKFDYSFFNKDTVYKSIAYTLLQLDEKSDSSTYESTKRFSSEFIPINSSDYIGLIAYIFYGTTKTDIPTETKYNIFNKISTAIDSLNPLNNKNKDYNSLKAINDMLNDCSAIFNQRYSELDKENKSVQIILQNQFKKHFHRNFFNSLNHPICELLCKRVNIEEIYFRYLKYKENSSNDNGNYLSWVQFADAQNTYADFEFKDSFYYLNLLELLMQYDINLFHIEQNNLFQIEKFNLEPRIWNDTYNTYKIIPAMPVKIELPKPIDIKDTKNIIENTLDFIYDCLNTYKYTELTLIRSLAELYDSFVNENSDNKEININEATHIYINDMCEELDRINKLILNEPEFIQIPTESPLIDDTIHKYPLLFAYLIKASLITDQTLTDRNT